jgi:hypothetical protein
MISYTIGQTYLVRPPASYDIILLFPRYRGLGWVRGSVCVTNRSACMHAFSLFGLPLDCNNFHSFHQHATVNSHVTLFTFHMPHVTFFTFHMPGAMEVGDVSWHHGWTLHCAGPQPEGTPPRVALAISFFADGARLVPRRKKTDPSVHLSMMHTEDAETFEGWRSSLKDGAIAAHPLLPIVWPSKA